MANPQALDDFLAYARTQRDHVHQPTTRPEGDAHGR
jgi:hypothetical protein